MCHYSFVDIKREYRKIASLFENPFVCSCQRHNIELFIVVVFFCRGCKKSYHLITFAQMSCFLYIKQGVLMKVHLGNVSSRIMHALIFLLLKNKCPEALLERLSTKLK